MLDQIEVVEDIVIKFYLPYVENMNREKPLTICCNNKKELKDVCDWYENISWNKPLVYVWNKIYATISAFYSWDVLIISYNDFNDRFISSSTIRMTDKLIEEIFQRYYKNKDYLRDSDDIRKEIGSMVTKHLTESDPLIEEKSSWN